MKERPVFVTGASQTGKSLLARLLKSRSNIAFFTQEDRFWQRFYGEFGDLSRQENFDRCFDAFIQYSRGLGFEHDEASLHQVLSQRPRSYIELYASIQEDYARQAGRPRWGAHSDGPQVYAESILQRFSGAKFIHIIRDPRDRWVNMKNPTGTQPAGLKKLGRIGADLGAWLRSVDHAEKNRKRFPDAYMVLPFESMVCEPVETMRRICDFIDAPDSSPDRRDISRDEFGLLAKHLDCQDVTAEFVGFYRSKIPPREVAYIQRQAGVVMERLGYELDSINLSAIEQVRLNFVDRCVNFTRQQAGHVLRRRTESRRALALSGPNADVVHTT